MAERYPKLAEDDLFVLWFLRAFVTDDEGQAIQSLTGGSGDKSVDGVYFDDSTKTVVVVQGKYSRGIAVATEKRSDVVGFAQLAGEVGGDSRRSRTIARVFALKLKVLWPRHAIGSPNVVIDSS